MLRLPKAPAAILARIEMENDQHLVQRRANAARIRELKERRGECESRLRIALANGPLQRPRQLLDKETGAQIGQEIVEDDSNATVEQDEIEAINAQIARLTEINTATRKTAIKIRAELDEHTKYVTHAVKPTPRKGESNPQALDRYRQTIESKREERKAVTKASRTFEEVREAAMSNLRGMVARGVPNVLPAYQGRAIEWPKAQVPNPGSAGYAFVPDGAALVAWLFQSELERKLDSLLQMYRDDNALSETAQRAKIEEIDAELDKLFREEAALVEAIVAEGGGAFHFSDRPAEAVLGIRRL